ncbi:MAG: RagB/SusD family nutrient uptake outer membrane protein [Bacteroidetes bacterium]|nr:RagB/SusD family nutrient uptake outer membrane protein [Bacteroidota bacterium]
MKTIYIYLFIFAVVVTSCNVLDQVSPSQVSTSTVFTNAAGAESALVGMYSSMQNSYYYGAYFPLLSDVYSDVSKAGGFNVTALDEISNYQISTGNILVQNMYVAIYYTIAAANGIIANVPGIKDPTFTQAQKDSIVGQAYAVRAMAHFDLLRTFGQHWNLSSIYGIPVVTSVQTYNSVVSRSTVAQTYQAIISDLQQANSLLPSSKPYLNAYINPDAVQALLARVYLYKKDYVNAIAAASQVISDGSFGLLGSGNFTQIYSSKLSKESVFELVFNVQNQSAYNSYTYSRTQALVTEVLFKADTTMNIFYNNHPADLRAQLVDFSAATESNFLPYGRTQKYRGEINKDNSAYIIRMAEVYLIRAEAKALSGDVPGGLADLNSVRTNRGLAAYTNTDISNLYAGDFVAAVLDERFSELNFEGHRMFDLARTQRRSLVLNGSGADDYTDIFPIPNRELVAINNSSLMFQNPGY